MSEPSPESEAREATGESAGESAAQDALRRLEARLTQASEAAERLIAEAAETVAGPRAERATGPGGEQASAPRANRAAGPDGERPPDAGWQEPRAKRPDAEADLELLGEVVRRLRDLVPPDLQRRLAEALRELLLALRALIDWYLDRIERRRAEPPQMTDIPIL